MNEVSVNELTIIANLAWEQTMGKTGVCDCGADKRTECRCQRTEEYQERSTALKELLLPDAWQKDALEMEMKNLVEDGDDTE